MNINVNRLNGMYSYMFRNGQSGRGEGKKVTVSGNSKREKDRAESWNKASEILAANREQNTPSARETQRIMLKFRSGKKLSYAELDHLRKTSPETYRKVQQVQSDRERLEEQMRRAKSAKEVDNTYMAALSTARTAGISSGDDLEARFNQYRDAYLTERKRREDEEREKENNKKEAENKPPVRI